MNFAHKPSRPRSPRGIQTLSNHDLATLIAVLETDLLNKIGCAQHPDYILRFRLASIRRAITPMTQLGWCYHELVRRANAGLLVSRKESRE